MFFFRLFAFNLKGCMILLFFNILYYYCTKLIPTLLLYFTFKRENITIGKIALYN